MRQRKPSVRRAIVAAVAILGLTVGGISVGIQAPRAAATTAGTPGTPQPPTALFTEDFSGQNAASTAIKITSYQGTPGSTYVPGVSGANSETYYADPRWADGLYCNGYIVNGSTTPAPPGWNSGCPISGVQILANAMGQYQGYSTAAAAQNQAVTAYTASGTVPGIQLRTNTAIPAVPGHFYQVTSIVAATNCVANSSGNPAETLSLFINGVKNVLASQLDPCNYPGAVQYGSGPFGPTMVAGLTSAAIKVPSTGTPTVGMQLENQSAVVAGNDGAFDLPQILDVTPQLDKAFSPATIASGQTSTLTFTITNTSELAAKNGWSFHDDLPAGVTATGVNATTCSSGTVTAAAGSTSVVVANGTLTQGQNACTVTVQVTATVPGTYTNGPGNFPEGTAGLDGLNPPADTPLTVTPPASLLVTKASSTTAITRVGQVVTYKFVVTNRSQVTLHGISVVDAQTPPASQANLSAILCETQTLAPQASTTCTARYTVTQADLDNGSVHDTATASGLDPGGATVTAPPATLTITSARPAISVVKSTTTTLASSVGQQIPYRFLVTNTGNVTLFGVSVTDTPAPPASSANLSAITCPNPALAPGESQSCTGMYTATLADLQNGTLADSATASGTPEGGTAVTSAPSDLSIPTQLPGSLTIRKATTTAAVTAIGQVIPYTFLVTNNSTVVVNNVVVTDTVEAPSLPANLTTPSCPQTTLAPGASTTCTASYRVTSADVNAGVVADHARASGTDPVGNPVLSSPSRVELFSPVSALTIVKSTTATSVSAVGQLVPYAFLVTNTGNQVLTNVAVTDTQVPPASQANMSAVSCPQTTLNPGASMSCTGTYQVTAADLGNGSVNDFATASGRNPAGATVTSPQSAASVNATPAALTMVKASSTNSFNAVGQPVRYTFTVTNNSSTAYRNITIQDTQVAPATQSRLSLITCDRTTLAPSQVAVCSATYSVTAADITNGWLSDFATATGVDVASNTYTTARSSTIIPAIQSPAITVTKTSTVTRITALGQEVPYVFTVRNTGNVDVTDVTVADSQTPPATPANMSAVTCPPGALAPGDTVDCTGTYTVTQADLDHGLVADTATARATDPTGNPVDALETRLRITANPALTIEKSSTTTLITAIGQQVPYEFLVTNIRTTPVSNVRVDDTQIFPSSQAGMSAIVCDDVTLAPGASTLCHGTYTATAADIANGAVDDSAVAEGTDSNGLPLPPSEPSELAIPAQQSPELTVAKSSSTSVITAVGQTLTYRFLITNTGNVRIDGVDVEDVQLPPAQQGDLSPIACPYPSLEPGQSQTCTATYTVSQADVANGSVADFAIATGTTPGGAAVRSTPSALSIPAPSTPPAISIVKSSSSQGVSTLNEQIPYSFEVTNNSAVTLTEVRVTDTQAPPASQSNLSSVTCPSTTLASGASMTCTATYTTTQPDFDHGRIDDSAVATGRDPGGTVVQSSPSTFVVLVDPVDNSLTIDKRSTTTTITQVGQQVPYQFVVTNTGTQTITALSVTDVVASPSAQSNLSAVTCPTTPLAPNATTTCTATYTTTEADLNNGSVNDSATAHGTTPAGLPIHSAEDALSLPTVAAPAITVVKSSTTTAVVRVGQQIPYEFLVTNTGNVTLANIAVTDTVAPPSLPGGLTAVTCPTTTVPPAGTVTCTATYTVTQADIDHGTVNDTATASGTQPATPGNPNPAPTTSGPSTVSLPVDYQAELTILKSSAAPEVTRAGETIPYTFLVTNTGNLSISDIQVTDTVTAPSDPANLTPVVCPVTVLAPGASTTCTASYTTTQADVDSGQVHDTAVASGRPAPSPGDPTPGPVVSTGSQVTLLVASDPALTVVKSSPQTANPPTAAGQQIQYEFLVENTGNETLADVTVEDVQVAPATQANLSPVTCPPGPIAPGARITCTATYTVTQADVDNGAITDQATASGQPPTTPQNPNPPRITSPQTTLTVSAAPVPAITVTKSSPTATVTRPGQVVPYAFLVTNSGNVTLSGIAIDDQVAAPSSPANLSAISCPQTTLAPQATTICTATYTVTQADVDNGSVVDSATASGLPPATPGDPNPPAVVSPVSTVTIDADRVTGITVVKTSTTTAIAQAGQQVPYEFLVTNTGTVTLSGIVVDDQVAAPSDPANLSAVTCPQTALAPAATMTCTATYTVAQADVDSGSVSDSATAFGTPPATPTDPTPPPVGSPISTVTLAVADQPALTVAKSSSTPAITQVGQVVPFAFLVTNTGNVTLTGITVDDQVAAPSDPANLSAISCPVTTLAPTATTTCTGTYTVTQADVDSGAVADSVTASGTPPATPADPNPPTVGSPVDTLTIAVTQAPALTVAKSSTTTAVTQVGQVVPYDFLVTNTGNVTLSGIQVDDIQEAPASQSSLSAVTCPPGLLAPGAQVTCTATYTVTQADVDHGSITDRATASGLPPATPADPTPPRTVSPESTLSIPSPATSSLTVTKSSTTAVVSRVGQRVPYEFLVTNTGTSSLTGVTVADQVAAPSDPANLSPVDCPQGSLAPAQTMTCTATYTVTQADVDNGSVTDTATATGTPPATPTDPTPSPVTSPPSTVTLAATPAPGLTVDKTTETGAVTMAGQQVVFQFAVQNTGNVTLDGIVVTDTVAAPSDQANLSPVSCPAAVLAPGERMTCTATYTVTAADMMLATSISDTAVATGIGPDGGRVGSPESTLALPVRAIAHLPIVTG
ncbi:putative repeat protein (TIGR01451 family) [Leifsonia sp. 563]|uniref:DUF7507 domain-containing protein n=1 Tax=Leifsonia sp. 563 TaxID=3156412 RepID=UPI003393D777